jgi:hypothetical protein
VFDNRLNTLIIISSGAHKMPTWPEAGIEVINNVLVGSAAKDSRKDVAYPKGMGRGRR